MMAMVVMAMAVVDTKNIMIHRSCAEKWYKFVPGGGRSVEIPSDKINMGFVLGNKVVVGTVNANREYFELGVKDFSQAEMQWPGWLSKLLTHPI